MKHASILSMSALLAAVAISCTTDVGRDQSAHDLYESVMFEIPQYQPEVESMEQTNDRFFQNLRQKLGRPTLCTSNEIVYLNRPNPADGYPPSRPMIVFQRSHDGYITNCCYRGTYDRGPLRGTYIGAQTNQVRGIMYGPPGYEDADGHFVEHGTMIWRDEKGLTRSWRFEHGKVTSRTTLNENKE